MAGSGDHDPYRRPLRDTASPSGAQEIERDCTKLSFVTTLQQRPSSPVLVIGETLELLRVPTGEAIAIAAVDDGGRIVGTIVEELADLLRCTASGVAFVARVVTVSHGIHTIRVRSSDVTSACEGSYRTSAPPRSVTGQLALTPNTTDVQADVVVAENTLARDGICEVRSLLRSGVPLRARVDGDGAVLVSQQ
jgi:hypothetical protein